MLRIVGSIEKVATLHGLMNLILKSKLTFDGTFVGPNALAVTVYSPSISRSSEWKEKSF